MDNIQDNIHDFKEYIDVEYTPAHWEPADEKILNLPKGEI